MPNDEDLEVGDYVTISDQPHPLTWQIHTIESRIDPLGTILISGQTGRLRRESLANCTLFKKGNTK